MLPLLIVLGGVAYSGFKALRQHRDQPPVRAVATGIEKIGLPEAIDHSSAMQLLSADEANHYLKMTGAAAAAAVVTVFYPPAGLAAAALLTYAGTPLFKSATVATFVDQRPRASHVELVVYVTSVATGYYFLASLCSGVYYFGYKLLAETQSRSTRQLHHLFGENPRHVWLAYNGVEVEVPFDSLQVGDVIVLQAGEYVPIDGTVVSGVATVDQRTLTGEALPVERGAGDAILASTSLLAGKLHVRVEKTGSATTAASIQRVLNNTVNYTDAVEQEAVRLSNRMAAPALIAGGITGVLMGPMQGVAMVGCEQSELNRISAPLGMLNFLEMASERGVLIKDGRCLEILKGVDTVIFDKTGTLTLDQPQVAFIHVLGAVAEPDVLRYAAAAEARQSHPIAHAIRAAAEQRGLPLPPLDEVRYELGYGLAATIDGHQVHVGSARYMRLQQVQIGDAAQLDLIKEHCDRHGFSLVYVAHDQVLIGLVELHASVRPEARAVIRQLQQRGLELIIVSGDNEGPTARVAEYVGIKNWHASILPDDKALLIQRLRAEGRSICFVGDGINDAVALKTANVGVSIHGASDAALDTANVILMDRTLSELGTLFQFAEDIAQNRRYGYYATMVPSALGAAGVIWLGFGIPAALGIYVISGVVATATAMWPRLTRRQFPRALPLLETEPPAQG